MKIFTNKNLIQKLVIAIVCVTLFNFCVMPTKVHAGIGGELFDLLKDFTTFIGDIAVSLIQWGFTGEWSFAVDEKESATVDGGDGYFIDDKNFRYPIIQVSPELIFGNEIQMLDIDFIGGTNNKEYLLKSKDGSAISILRTIIASWYVTLRTIAIVGLLSVLIYVGIRIIISSTSQDKAKYKQRLMDWVVAFVLLFFMHYIMAAMVTVIDRVDKVLGESTGIGEGISLDSKHGYVIYKSGNIPLPNSETILMDGITDPTTGNNNAINSVKEMIAENNHTIISESNDWTKAGNKWTYNYIITCSEAIYTIQRKEQQTTMRWCDKYS